MTPLYQKVSALSNRLISVIRQHVFVLVMSGYIPMKGQPRRELKREHAHGYRLEEVVADLVDNSIDANAENIWIVFAEEAYKHKNSFYLICMDDGKGIDSEGISSVMDFGAPREYDELDLGKFGVGMKSSSLSQAKEITLLSKTINGKIELRRLSSEIVNERDEWVLIDTLEEDMHTDAISIAKRELSNRKSGTCIVLEDMHKLDNRVGNMDNKEIYMNKEIIHIRDYLGLIFERYICGTTLKKNDGTTVERKINIFLNGKEKIHQVKYLDPFCKELKDGKATGTLSHTFNLSVNRDGENSEIPVTIWITPKETDRTDHCSFGTDNYDDRMKNAGRDSGISELQGIYIYRNERLINFASWHNVGKHEPHLTCDRWELHFPSSLDEIFQLDPSKRSIELPTEISEALGMISRTSTIRWHNDDRSTSGHRKRARLRQKGGDKVISHTIQTTLPSSNTTKVDKSSKPDISKTFGRGNNKSNNTNVVKNISVKVVQGSSKGDLLISSRATGSTLNFVLNSNSALYEQFIEEIKKL